MLGLVSCARPAQCKKQDLTLKTRLKNKVFEPLFTTRRESGGSGLGLAVSYSIIHQAGGQIECESTLGQGTCFTIRLPVDLENA